MESGTKKGKGDMRLCTKPNHIGRFFKCDKPRGSECIWGCKYAARPAILAGLVRRDMHEQQLQPDITRENKVFTSNYDKAWVCRDVIRRNIGENI